MPTALTCFLCTPLAPPAGPELEYMQVGSDCNCGHRVARHNLRAPYTPQACWEAVCKDNENCKSFGIWTRAGNGACIAFDAACGPDTSTESCPEVVADGQFPLVVATHRNVVYDRVRTPTAPPGELPHLSVSMCVSRATLAAAV